MHARGGQRHGSRFAGAWPTALLGLRSHPVVATLLAATFAAATASALPGLQSGLTLVPRPGEDPGLAWSTAVQLPMETRQHGVNALAAMLLAAALATLAVAVVTIVALSAAREARHAGTISVQRAVGASRRTLLAAALLEAGLLVAAGLGAGLPVGLVLARAGVARWPGIVHSNLLTAAAPAILGLSLVVGAGIALPILWPRRRLGELEPHRRLPIAPTAFQLGFGLIALTAGALVARGAAALTATSAGGRAAGTVARVGLPDTTPSDRADRFAELLRQMRTHGFDSVSLSSGGALQGLGPVGIVTTECGRCTEGGIWVPWRVKPATHLYVSADTFRLLGIPVVEGRGISAEDTGRSPRIAVVSRSLASREFQDGEAVGRRIQVADDGDGWSTVVGVVEDRQPQGLGGGLQPRYAVYLSVLQHPPASAALLVRDPPPDTPRRVRPLLEAALGPSVPDGDWRSEASSLAAEAAPLRWFGRAFALQGWMMLGLALPGAFALMHLWVQSLLGELGVRRAVGARRRDIYRFVLVRAAGAGLIGAAVGLWFGWPVWRDLPRIVAGIAPWNTALVLNLAGLLVGSALTGALVPAWRAARVSPAKLLAS